MNWERIIGFLLTASALFALCIGGIGYLVGVFRKNKQQAANSETTKIYEELNDALKQKVAALEEKLDEAVKNIDMLNNQVERLRVNLSHNEDLIVRSLREYWDEHPIEARALSQAKEVRIKHKRV